MTDPTTDVDKLRLPNDQTPQQLAAQNNETIQPESIIKNGCPCICIGPCSSECSCVYPEKSGGCKRCAKHGSSVQRIKSARRLAGRDARIAELEAKITELENRPEPVPVILQFNDWRKGCESVRESEEGIRLRNGNFHHGSYFDGTIVLGKENRDFLEAEKNNGYFPVFKALIFLQERTKHDPET